MIKMPEPTPNRKHIMEQLLDFHLTSKPDNDITTKGYVKLRYENIATMLTDSFKSQGISINIFN